jgi:acetyl esterase
VSLDPQVADLLGRLDAGFPAVHTMTGAQARAAIRARFVPPAEPEPVGDISDQTIPGSAGFIPVRIYVPAHDFTRALPILVYAHGGGFVFCDLDSHDGLCRSLANMTQAVVISVDYRLAPEHRWPAAAEDLYAAAQWAAEHAHEVGGDATRIAVGGDSAGGNLAAVAALMARDRGTPILAAQLLLYPMTAADADFDSDSYRRFGSGFYNPLPALRWYWDQYVPSAADRRHKYASPLNAELEGLPPAVVVIAGHDPLRDDGMAFADALAQAGVPVSCRHFEGGIHGFMTMPVLGIARQARQQACMDLASLLAPPRDSDPCR